MRGFLYILSDPAMPKLLKIGYTTRTLDNRVSELAGTGVPIPFEIEFFIEVDQAARLEKAMHTRLGSARFGKEFFRCNIQDAVKAAKELTIEKEITVYSQGGPGDCVFLTNLEINLLRQKEIEKKYKEATERQRKINEAKILERKEREIIAIEQRFNKIAPAVDSIIDQKWKIVNNFGLVRGVVFVLSVASIVGMPLADKVMPPHDEVVRKMVKLLTKILINSENWRQF